MSRRVSSGGGQSSLGYLFGSDDKNQNNSTTSPPQPPPAVAKPVVYSPPYGIDTGEGEENIAKPPQNPSSSPFHNQRPSSNSISSRPSTKVTSVPGGDSSLGYLFGEKS